MNLLKYVYMTASITCCCFLTATAQTGLENPKLFKIGETEFIFYMTPEKYKAAKDLVNSLNEKQLLLVVEMNDHPYITTEISAISSISPESVNGMTLDPLGNAVLDQYAEKVMNIAKNDLQVEIEGASREINLIVSQDAHKFHRDQFKKQYDYLNENHDTLPKSQIIHDLTLIDWNMSKGTISGTIFQDEGGDRLLIALFPNSVVGIITAEPPVYPENNQPPEFPGPTTLPYHAALSPVDYHGDLSSGSSKGQRISTVVRGIVRGDAFKDIRSKATPLTPFRPIQENDEMGLTTVKYENGMFLKQFKDKPKVDLTWNYKMPDQENVEILKTDPKSNLEMISLLQSMFGINDINIENVRVRHLIKKDGGFSKIDLMDLDIPSSYSLVLVNSSTLPQDYKYFNLAEDLTNNGYPWIHLYQFHQDMAMQIDYDSFKKLSLTPLEELIFRDEYIDNHQKDGIKMLSKPVTRIDIFAFPKN